MNLVISIVSYNTKELLRNCLNSIFENSVSGQEVWVLDNASADGSAEMVADEFKKVHLIKSQKNLGFAKGHNKILSEAKFDYVLFLNPDTKLSHEVIDRLVKFMVDNPECGIASVKITDFAGSLQPSGGDLPFGMALVSWLFNLEFLGIRANFHRFDPEFYQKAHEVGWVAGTFMMVKAEVFKKIGFFNEDYFMYFEDVEFCYKAHKAGFKIMLVPEITIAHLGGASSKDPQFNQWRGEMQNLLKFYKNSFDGLTNFVVRVLIYKALFLRIMAFGLMGKFSVAKTYGRIMNEI